MRHNIRVAMLDSGLSAELQLPENVRILGTRSFCYDHLTDSVLEGTKIEDLNGHGTMCVSTILPETPNDTAMVRFNANGISDVNMLRNVAQTYFLR